MRSKISAMALVARALVLSLLIFACFTASLYLPHQSSWWHVAMIALIVMFGVSTVRGYRRGIEVHKQSIEKESGKA